MSESSGSQFTIVDALTIGFGVLLLVALMMALELTSSSNGGRQITSNTQLRGIHQAMVMYAQGNNSYYPGLDHTGAPVAVTVEERYRVLLEGNYFSADQLLNPSDSGKTAWTTGPVTSANYSYAMLDIDTGGERATEWRDTMNTYAAMLSDRNTGADAHGQVMSVHTNTPGDWRGSVAYNDNHVVFETTHVVEMAYGAATQPADDNLFEAAGPDDGFLIDSGR